MYFIEILLKIEDYFMITLFQQEPDNIEQVKVNIVQID